MSNALKIVHVYDDATENLLNQYTQQLAHYEKIFEANNQHLSKAAYARHRDRDPIMLEILDVIAKIYEKAIPIAILVENGPTMPSAGDAPTGGTKH